MSIDPTPFKIGYLSSEYPCVSHTFIRREILGLEKLGHNITRIGIRRGEILVDADDLAELEKTHTIVGTGQVSSQLRNFFVGLRTSKLKVLRGLRTAFRLGWVSHRGMTKHLLYFFEAIILHGIIREQKVSHLHVHFGNNAAAIALICKQSGGPSFSMTVHGPDEFDAPVGESLGNKVSESLFTTAITSYCRGQLMRWTPHEHWDRIHEIHCTVGPEWFDASQPLTDQKDLVCVGRLTRNKGQLLLIEAVAEAKTRGFSGKLVLVGDGEMRTAIEKRISDLQLESQVELLGWQSGSVIQHHIANCRCLVLASFAEGLPVVIMESMAMKRPVISSLITGIPELIQNNIDGWLVTSGDRRSLANAIVEMSEMPVEDIEKMGAASQKRVLERHSTDTEVGKLEKLFQQYLS
jgi:glycosyltransferase involved in cell wall biosynthesis